MRIIRITLLKLQALKLSELGCKYLRNYSVGSTEVDLKYGSMLMLGSGSSVTGTVTCGNTAPDNGTFVNNSGTTVTTSGC